MKKVYKIIIFTLLLFVIGLGSFQFVSAEEAKYPAAIDRSIDGLRTAVAEAELGVGSDPTQTDPFTVIGQMISFVLSASAVILLIIVLYGGLTWMTAAGDDAQVAKGRKIIIHGVIGLIVTISSYMIAQFVITKIIAVG
jgi:hypothetical protein